MFNDIIGVEVSFNVFWGGYVLIFGLRIKYEFYIVGFFNLVFCNGVGFLVVVRIVVEEINDDFRYFEDYKIELY